MKSRQMLGVAAAIGALVACGSDNDSSRVAEHVYQNGYIYTLNDAEPLAEAVAVQGGEIIYVGTTEGAQDYVANSTLVVDLANKMMLPGLHDVHIHPAGIVDVDVCDFGVEETNLDEIVARFEECKTTYGYGPNDVIAAFSWNSYFGNTPTENYSSMIQALDAVSTTQPVYLVGPDGHSGAANSYAFNNVKNEQGEAAPAITSSTLSTIYADFTDFIGVDAQGNPNGYLSEAATYLLGVPFLLSPIMDNLDELPEMPEKLNKYGITSVQDAMVDEEVLNLYKLLADNDQLTFRITAAQKYDVSKRINEGQVNFSGIISDLNGVRESLKDQPYIKADAVKIVVDGVHEGNPLAFPPTLPTSFMLNDFKQPVFGADQEGNPLLLGYVDQESELCNSVRSTPSDVDEVSEIETFINTHGYHPSQCIQSKGELLASDENGLALKENGVNRVTFLNDFISTLDAEGYVAHLHAIGDGAVRASIDAIEVAKTNNPNSELPHAIAHMQTVHPDDQTRLGNLGIYAAFTYAWANPDYFYNLSVIPFVEELDDLQPQTLFNPESYYMNAVYPTKSVLEAGATLVAGSDAPVDTREPLPFVHMAAGITRADDSGVLNESETVSIQDMIQAYTINGAKALRQDDIVGSIEVGKRADLIVLDQNIVSLAESEDPMDARKIAETQVLTTIFDGKVVYNIATPQ